MMLAVFTACQKSSSTKDRPVDGTPASPDQQVTISVSMPEEGLATKVTMERDEDNKKVIKLAWENDDVITINDNVFTIVPESISEDGKSAQFTGNVPAPNADGQYVIIYDNMDNDFYENPWEQTQSIDGDMAHLGYCVSLEADTYADVSFTQAWAEANGGTISQSSVLELRAKLPADVASDVQKVIFKSSTEDMFYGSEVLTVTLETPGTSEDNILDIYAIISDGCDMDISDTDLLIQFQVSDNEYDKYTAFRHFGEGYAILGGHTQYIAIDCLNIESFANASTTDIGTATNPYLVGDQHQMQAINGLLVEGSSKYFKLVDDIDMTDVSWTNINPASPYKPINLDGNSKTISNLSNSLFYVFKGSIQNLTLENCTASNGTNRGVFTQYIQGTGYSVTNVDVRNSTVEVGNGYIGGLIGRINGGVEGVTAATITDCDVIDTGVTGKKTGTGGLIGCVEAKVVVSNCTVSNSEGSSIIESSSDNTGGLIGFISQDSENSAFSSGSTITDCTVSGKSVTGAKVVGGIIGYVNATVTVSGCTYTGGSVTASGCWAGGAIGSIGEFAAVVSACSVENATVSSSSDRVGGFVGQISPNATVKGCTVGKSSKRVNIVSSMGAATANVGGFVGVCYGIVTDNEGVRNNAFVTITSTNTDASKYVNFGGFVGYLETHQQDIATATIEYSDADADMSSVKGQQVGGFVAIATKMAPAKIDHCSSNVTVNSGANYAAGFIAMAAAANHVITNNSSSGSVSGAATVGGFAGMASQGTWTNNTTSCTVVGSGANVGGFAGQINGNISISKCSATGASVTASGNVCGGFAAIAANGANITDCYSTMELKGGTRKRGGMIGHVTAGTVSIERCYATGNINANFELGGLVGYVAVPTFTLNDCAAWNGSITASNCTNTNWSSGAIIGITHPNCHASNNFRSPDMELTVWCVPDADFDQPDIDGTTTPLYWNSQNKPFTWSYCDQTSISAGSGNSLAARWAYHGKHVAAGTKLSTLASTAKASGGLGWSSEVWDFTDDLPTLK